MVRSSPILNVILEWHIDRSLRLTQDSPDMILKPIHVFSQHVTFFRNDVPWRLICSLQMLTLSDHRLEKLTVVCLISDIQWVNWIFLLQEINPWLYSEWGDAVIIRWWRMMKHLVLAKSGGFHCGFSRHTLFFIKCSGSFDAVVRLILPVHRVLVHKLKLPWFMNLELGALICRSANVGRVLEQLFLWFKWFSHYFLSLQLL